MDDSHSSRTVLIATGISMGMVGGLLSLTIVGAIVGIPLTLAGILVIILAVLGIIGDSEDESSEASSPS